MKNWWDNFLSPEERNRILTHIITKADDQGKEIEEEAASGLLIHTITLHFLGNPKEDQAAAKTILINLRCLTLTDYIWCKDVFLTNVLKREDGMQNFWKEKFIAVSENFLKSVSLYEFDNFVDPLMYLSRTLHME